MRFVTYTNWNTLQDTTYFTIQASMVDKVCAYQLTRLDECNRIVSLHIHLAHRIHEKKDNKHTFGGATNQRLTCCGGCTFVKQSSAQAVCIDSSHAPTKRATKRGSIDKDIGAPSHSMLQEKKKKQGGLRDRNEMCGCLHCKHVTQGAVRRRGAVVAHRVEALRFIFQYTLSTATHTIGREYTRDCCALHYETAETNAIVNGGARKCA